MTNDWNSTGKYPYGEYQVPDGFLTEVRPDQGAPQPSAHSRRQKPLTEVPELCSEDGANHRVPHTHLSKGQAPGPAPGKATGWDGLAARKAPGSWWAGCELQHASAAQTATSILGHSQDAEGHNHSPPQHLLNSIKDCI